MENGHKSERKKRNNSQSFCELTLQGFVLVPDLAAFRCFQINVFFFSFLAAFEGLILAVIMGTHLTPEGFVPEIGSKKT